MVPRRASAEVESLPRWTGNQCGSRVLHVVFVVDAAASAVHYGALAVVETDAVGADEDLQIVSTVFTNRCC
jgi:hypothetical protein